MADEQHPHRNPFRNEADAFRILMMVVGAGAVVVAITLLAGTTPGFIAAIVLGAVGLYMASNWARYWLGTREDQD